MRRKNKCAVLYRIGSALAVLFIGAFSGTDTVWSSPITFNTALPVAQGEFVAREQFIISESGDDPSSLRRDRNASAAVTVLGYGVSGKLALFGVLPYRDNELKLTIGGQRHTRQANGFGDLTVFGRYTVFQRDRRGTNLRVAPFAGIKTPTGKDNEHDGLGRLPASVQVGSGSWDPLLGVVATYQTFGYQIDGQLAYQLNTEANDFEAGDVARADGSFKLRIWPRELGSGVPAFLYGVVEANLSHQQKNRFDGSTNPDTGGTRLFLTPGLQYVTKRWIAETALQIPVVQNLHGDALENDYIARVSVRFNF